MHNIKNVFWNLVFTWVLLIVGHTAYKFLGDLVNHFRTHPSEQ